MSDSWAGARAVRGRGEVRATPLPLLAEGEGYDSDLDDPDPEIRRQAQKRVRARRYYREARARPSDRPAPPVHREPCAFCDSWTEWTLDGVPACLRCATVLRDEYDNY